MDSFRSVDLLFCCLPVCLCVWKKSNPRHGQFKISWSAIQCLCLPVCLCLSVNLFVCVEETQPQTWAVSDQLICHSVHLFACLPVWKKSNPRRGQFKISWSVVLCLRLPVCQSVCLCGRNPTPDVGSFRSVDLSFCAFVCMSASVCLSVWKKPKPRCEQIQISWFVILCLFICLSAYIYLEETQPQTWAVSGWWTCHVTIDICVCSCRCKYLDAVFVSVCTCMDMCAHM